ncbi:MAG TPA: tol-pal system protein YbgF [Longimicrobiales bacterium]
MRRGVGVAVLAMAAALSACATKSDIRTLQETLTAMQMHQDSVLRNIQIQNRLMLDTLRSSMALTLDTRGQTSHRFEELGRLVDQTRQLVGENLAAMNALMGRIDALETKLNTAAQAPAAAPTSPATDQNAAQLYARGMERLNEGAYAAARTVFQGITRQYPKDPVAADAQYQLGEVYYAEQNYSSAYTAFEAVPAGWPESVRAGEALYRAGVIAQERKETARARRYYDAVIEQYAGSDAAKAAESRRKSLPR